MKTFKMLLLFAFALFAFNACSSDDDTVKNTLEKEYFTVEDGKFVDGTIGGGDKNFISSVTFNRKVINGGTSIVSFISTKEVKIAKVAFKDIHGYYECSLPTVVATETGNLYYYDILIIISQSIIINNFIIEFTAIALDGDINVIKQSDEINVIEAGIGELQVSLSWIEADDVDLHLFTPSGKHVYYYNRILYNTNGEIITNLDIDSNANCWIDNINNENIFSSSTENGVYSVYVDLYKKCQSGANGAKYATTVNYKGNYYKLSDKMRGEFAPSNPGSGNTPSKYAPIGTFTINNGVFTVGGTQTPAAQAAVRSVIATPKN